MSIQQKQPHVFDAPVVEVTLQEDRACVVRRGTGTLHAGVNRLRISEVSPIIADKTLCGAIRVTGVADDEDEPPKVSDLRVRRRQVARSKERTEATHALIEQRRALQVQIKTAQAHGDRLGRRLRAVEQIERSLVDEMSTDVAWGRSEPETWRAALEQCGTEMRSFRDAVIESNTEVTKLGETLARLEARIAAASKVRDTICADLEVEVVVQSSGSYELRVDYIVPGACWRPQHRAELVEDTNEPKLVFTSEGCVWQATGEDWHNVQLIFSTERPSLGTQPPNLATEVLHSQRKNDQIQVQVRQQTIQTTGVGGESKPSEELPGIDDGGEALALRAQHRIDVPCDGRPHRVPLMQFEDSVQLERILMAELVSAVVVKTQQVNRGRHPILAGPIDLIRGGGVCGRGKLMFVAPNERFEMGWGPEPGIRVRRYLDHEVEESSMLSSWTTQNHTVELRLSHLGGDPISLHVQERVAISEIEKVKIDVIRDKTTAGRTPDVNGFVHWDVTLAPQERKTIKLAYRVKKHGDVSGI